VNCRGANKYIGDGEVAAMQPSLLSATPGVLMIQNDVPHASLAAAKAAQSSSKLVVYRVSPLRSASDVPDGIFDLIDVRGMEPFP